MDYQKLIAEECDALKALLLEKNRKYGNSALEPKRIFSKAAVEEQIRVRVDDKLSRIEAMGPSASDEDTEQDLIGYLVLLRVSRRAAVESRPVGGQASTLVEYSATGIASVGPSVTGVTGNPNINWTLIGHLGVYEKESK